MVGDVDPAMRHAGRDDDDVAGLDRLPTTSAPSMRPLHDGRQHLVTSLSAADRRPSTILPPVTSVPPPEMMT